MVVIIILIDKRPNSNNDYNIITSFPFVSSDIDGDIRIGYLGIEEGDLALILTDVELPFESFGTFRDEGFKNALNALSLNNQLGKLTLEGTATFSYRFKGISYQYEFIPYEKKTDRDNSFYEWISGKRQIIKREKISPPSPPTPAFPPPQKLCSIFDTQSYFSSKIFQLLEDDNKTLFNHHFFQDETILPGYETDNNSETNIQHAITQTGFGEINDTLPAEFIKYYGKTGHKKILLAYAANKPPPHFDSILAWELVFKTPIPTFSSTPILIQYRKPEKCGYSYSLFSGPIEIAMTTIKIFGQGKYE